MNGFVAKPFEPAQLYRWLCGVWAVAGAPPPPAALPAPPAPAPSALELLAQLRARLSRGDAAARAMAVDHREALLRAYGPAGARLIDSVLHFDFDTANALAEGLLTEATAEAPG